MLIKTSTREIPIVHVTLTLNISYQRFTENLENLLGRFSENVNEELRKNPQHAQELLKKMEGEQGLMLFAIYEHGELLNIKNKPKLAKQYVLGNPLIAVSMTKQDIRSGLYAPLRIFVFAQDSKTTVVEFDKPSSEFGQFKNSEIDSVASALDEKLAKLIEKALITVKS